MATFGAKTALRALQPLNHYDGHRTLCTCDEKKTASMISGHTWNILNNSDKHEVYLLHARNKDHFLDHNGMNTNLWFEKKKRVDLDGDGVIDSVDSSYLEEAMIYPPDSGKEAMHLRLRQSKQLRQSEHPIDFGQYSARREKDGAKTPERGGSLAVTLEHHKRQRDVPARPSPRVISKNEFTPRRGVRLQERRPPLEHEMFRNVHQLRTESHFDSSEQTFADSVHSARQKSFTQTAKSSLSASGAVTEHSVLGDTATLRTQLGRDKDHLPPKPGLQRNLHSQNRVEPMHGREISGWPAIQQDRLRREDPFFAKPVQNAGSSSVKYDIISNERHNFWY
jgi:hypothetical protein